MYRISKRFDFSASHILRGLPDGHPCGRMHGHNYSVELVLEGETLDNVGFIRDYRELSEFKQWIDIRLDHRHLNDAIGDLNPTAENIARWIYDMWRMRYPELSCVRVSETPKTWAEYRPH